MTTRLLITSGQERQLERFIQDAIRRALVETELDRGGAQRVIENGGDLQSMIVAAIQRLSRSPVHHFSTKVSPIAEQIGQLHEWFPNLGPADKKIANQPLPLGADGWFAIPRWEQVASTYAEALQTLFEHLRGRDGDFEDCRDRQQTGPDFIRRADKTAKALQTLGEHQKNDVLIIAAQFSRWGEELSKATIIKATGPEEFGLDPFSVGCMLLTHPMRLGNYESIDCLGGECAPVGQFYSGKFDFVPTFRFYASKLNFETYGLSSPCGTYASGFLEI